MTNKVAYKSNKSALLTADMVKWMFDHGFKENDMIEYHNPIFIQCIEELNPPDWAIRLIDGDEYTVFQTLNDEVVLSRDEINNLKWRKIK